MKLSVIDFNIRSIFLVMRHNSFQIKIDMRLEFEFIGLENLEHIV